MIIKLQQFLQNQVKLVKRKPFYNTVQELSWSKSLKQNSFHLKITSARELLKLNYKFKALKKNKAKEIALTSIYSWKFSYLQFIFNFFFQITLPSVCPEFLLHSHLQTKIQCISDQSEDPFCLTSTALKYQKKSQLGIPIFILPIKYQFLAV